MGNRVRKFHPYPLGGKLFWGVGRTETVVNEKRKVCQVTSPVELRPTRVVEGFVQPLEPTRHLGVLRTV